MTEKSGHRIVGTAVPRKEGLDKATGRSTYIDDLTLPGMWHGATVRSKAPRGVIRGITFGPGVDWSEYVVATAADIPGQNHVPLFLEDQPLLADGAFNHPEEPVLLLGHPDRARLAAAVAAVRIEFDPLPPVLTLAESERKETVVWGEDNVVKRYLLETGDVDACWAEAAHIVEGEYETGAQEQLYIETNGVVAEATDEGITLWGSLQCPFYVHRALKTFFGLSDERVRVVQMETGGAFGGKEEYPSILAGHAALLARKCGHPVKMVYDREEDMVATTKRHPSRVRHRTAVDATGRLLGGDVEIALDAGAYATLSGTVLSRATIHAAGPYDWPAFRVRSEAFATNTPPSGAFRGFGAPQSLFALERHLDEIARVVGIAPEEFRRRNFLQNGALTATGQRIENAPDLGALMDATLAAAGYHEKRARFARENPTRALKRGIGFAAFMHGAGFTGSGETHLGSVVRLEGTGEGRVRILVSSTEFGQGTNTILCQVAAEALGADYTDVEIARPDTACVPNSGPTVASRTAMIVGRLVESAARGLRATLVRSGCLDADGGSEAFRQGLRDYVDRSGPLAATVAYDPPENIFWDDQRYRGDAYPAYAWAVYVAEVAVDTLTFTPTVEAFWAMQEVGRVLHPVLAAGQIEGGVAQGIGFALYEKVVWVDGRMANGQMTNYIVPTSADIPPIHVLFEEIPFAGGGYGAKGIGELPMDGPAPAILNAIADATGVGFNAVPLLPEDVMARLAEGGR